MRTETRMRKRRIDGRERRLVWQEGRQKGLTRSGCNEGHLRTENRLFWSRLVRVRRPRHCFALLFNFASCASTFYKKKSGREMHANLKGG